MATFKPSGFDKLPDELVQHIFSFVSPQDNAANVQQTSKRLARIGNEPLLWRVHCAKQFKYWDSKHTIEEKFASELGDTDWKALFTYRSNVDHETTTALEGILAGQIRRIEKFEKISRFGYDAKDTLLRHCRVHATADDALSRRFYSNAVLDHIHRGKALDEWWRLSKGEQIPVERVLGSFDMFILHDEHGDISEITEILDNFMILLRQSYPEVDGFPRRQKALTAATFLRNHNLTGLASELMYRDLQNNYIGVALRDPEHPSLPLVSAAIYSAFAQRLGLNAHCCVFPAHVYAVVYIGQYECHEGNLLADEEQVEFLHLDPFYSDVEVPFQYLKAQLLTYGISQTEFFRHLRPSTAAELVLRTSRNILATVQEFEGLAGDLNNTGHPTIRLYGNPFADMDHAFYSALWANFMLYSNPDRASINDRLQFIPLILERFERLYPMDAILLERYVRSPALERPGTDQWGLQETIRVVRAGDSMPKQVRMRDSPASKEGVKHHVGQVFQHRRYGYTAVIIGWDVECSMNPQWIAQNRVDNLSRGRHQSFYHALVEDNSIRYVAEENIDIIVPDLAPTLLGLAGRYFKRWDAGAHSFVSNIRDEYPDD